MLGLLRIKEEEWDETSTIKLVYSCIVIELDREYLIVIGGRSYEREGWSDIEVRTKNIGANKCE